MRYTLVVERSAAPGSWALYRDGELLAARPFGAAEPRAPAWAAELMAGLATLDVAPSTLTTLVAGTGPGSFSGIRAAIAFLQGLSLPRAVPLYGLPSAAGLADGCLRRTGHGCVAVVGDARRNRLWCAVYRRAPDGALLLAATGEPPSHAGGDFVLCTPDALAELVPPDARIVTPDGVRPPACLAEFARARGLTAEALMPSAAAIGTLFLAHPAAAPRDPAPVYLHPAVG